MSTSDNSYPDFDELDSRLDGYCSDSLYQDTEWPVMQLNAGKGIRALVPFTPLFTRILQHGKNAERAAAALFLGWIKSPDDQVIKVLLDSLHDPAEEVANAAARALRKLGIPAEANCAHVLALEEGNRLSVFRTLYRRASSGIVRVGRGRKMDLIIENDQLISREHLHIDFRPPQVRVADCGSKNGTYRNGVPFFEGFVSSGDIISLGTTYLVVRTYSRCARVFISNHHHFLHPVMR